MFRRVDRVAPPWWRGYTRADLRHDLPAGVTVAAYLIPQVMAYAQVAGLPPAAGLWAAVAALTVTPSSAAHPSSRSDRSPPPR